MIMKATVDAAYAVVHHLSHEWGDYGYRLSVEGIGWGGALAECSHSDGSTFYIVADRWGNVCGHADTREAAINLHDIKRAELAR